MLPAVVRAGSDASRIELRAIRSDGKPVLIAPHVRRPQH